MDDVLSEINFIIIIHSIELHEIVTLIKNYKEFHINYQQCFVIIIFDTNKMFPFVSQRISLKGFFK